MQFDQRQRDPRKPPVRGIPGSVFVVGLIGALGVAVYFAIYRPLFLQEEKYKTIQKETRKDIDQQAIQPGGMRVWSDPFKPLPKQE